MSFVPLDLADLEAGKPVKKELWEQVKNNLDDLRSGLDGVEESAAFDIYNLTVTNPSNPAAINRRLPVFRARTETRITGLNLSFPQVYNDESEDLTGTLEIDLEKSTDGGVTWNSILVSPIEATTEGVGDVITTIAFDTGDVELLDVGDMLRFRYHPTNIRTREPDHHILLTGEAI